MSDHVPYVETAARSSCGFIYCYGILYALKRNRGGRFGNRVHVETRRPNFGNCLNDPVMKWADPNLASCVLSWINKSLPLPGGGRKKLSETVPLTFVFPPICWSCSSL